MAKLYSDDFYLLKALLTTFMSNQQTIFCGYFIVSLGREGDAEEQEEIEEAEEAEWS